MIHLLLCSLAMVVASPLAAAMPTNETGAYAKWTISSEAPTAAVLPMLDNAADDVGAAVATPTPQTAAAPTLALAMGATDSDAPTSATSAVPAAGPDRPAQEVGDDVLSDQRGGFDIGGVNVTLGATIETSINGQLSLVTTVNWTDTTATTSQTVMGLLTPATAAQLQAGVLNTGHISMNVGDASVFLANDGQTAVIHNTSDGLQSILVNTANDTTISTQVTAAINLGGYSAFQNDFRAAALGASLSQAIGAATLGSAMH